MKCIDDSLPLITDIHGKSAVIFVSRTDQGQALNKVTNGGWNQDSSQVNGFMVDRSDLYFYKQVYGSNKNEKLMSVMTFFLILLISLANLTLRLIKCDH